MQERDWLLSSGKLLPCIVDAVADDNDDDDDGDSWMTAVSVDFRSDELGDKRVHHTSSFFLLSIIRRNRRQFIHDRLSLRLSEARRPRGHPRARSAAWLWHIYDRLEYRIVGRWVGQIVDTVAGQRPSVRTLTGRPRPARDQAVWILTYGDDDKRALRVGTVLSRRRREDTAAGGGAIDRRLTWLTCDTCRSFTDC